MKSAKVLYGGSGDSADILWLTGVKIHDPFYSFLLDGKVCALIGALEIGRARRTSKIDRFFDLSDLSASAKSKFPSDTEILAAVLKRERVRRMEVPKNFPARELLRLGDFGFEIDVCETEFFPERAVKKSREVSEIAKANTVASAGFALVQQLLETSKISSGKLFLEGKPLTSEFLRSEIEKLAVSMGADAIDTVVAAGNQACDPHEVGRGQIAADSLIVADIFPRLRASGYFGDMTRTFLKGNPSPKQIKLVETVLLAQEECIKRVAAGVSGADVHKVACEVFEDSGFSTAKRNGVWEGFIHSTGHGIGLEVHEAPYLSPRSSVPLSEGNVVTVEPGLYYRGVGGCRIEDNVLVGKRGAKLLSEYHYEWVVD